MPSRCWVTCGGRTLPRLPSPRRRRLHQRSDFSTLLWTWPVTEQTASEVAWLSQAPVRFSCVERPPLQRTIYEKSFVPQSHPLLLALLLVHDRNHGVEELLLRLRGGWRAKSMPFLNTRQAGE